MSRIFKSISLKETPVVINSPDYTAFEQPEPEAGYDSVDSAEPEAETSDDHFGIAEAMLGQAREQADSIIAEATGQVEELKKSAYEAAFEQGYQAGLAQGEEAGLAQISQTLDEAVKRAQYILALTDKQAAQMMESCERQIVDLSLAVASKILAREIAENPTVILPIIKTALEKVRDQEQITIRVCQEDYDLTLQSKYELQAWLNRDSALTILPDESLKQGDCVIETPYGTVDARIDSQFSLLKSALQEIKS